MPASLNGDFEKLRHEMVETAIAARGIRSKVVLDAMREVPREAFMPRNLRKFAYHDAALPVGDGELLAQPYVIAVMVEALGLRGGERVLLLGVGAGYAAAILSMIAVEVDAVEPRGPRAGKTVERFAELGYRNICVRHGASALGWPDHAPYDAIISIAGIPGIPETLKRQLRVGGRIVAPLEIGEKCQQLVCVTRVSEGEFLQKSLAKLHFIPRNERARPLRPGRQQPDDTDRKPSDP